MLVRSEKIVSFPANYATSKTLKIRFGIPSFGGGGFKVGMIGPVTPIISKFYDFDLSSLKIVDLK